mmetsp:Transcript_125361/g.351073  ORF Transcript_125361/g.351073 Transcript_125361/m.351073 type:complete len:467 (-) Transcript_125361:125-1525(-)
MLPASLSAKWLPRDFVETSSTGGILTVISYFTMIVIFTFELNAYLTQGMRSELALDNDDSRSQLQINFEVDMLGIECRNLNVMVIDQTRNEPVKSTAREMRFRNVGGYQDGSLHTISSSTGNESEEDEHERIVQQLQKADGGEELDADWADSHDGFRHKSFEHVIQYHDFTLINFFAGWCSHCQKFAPTWVQLVDQLKEKTFEDRDGKQRNVVGLKVNCVDFEKTCREQGIGAFPTLRLYKADGTLSLYKGQRDIPSILNWIELVVRTKSYGWGSHHSQVRSSCNVRGFIRIPRVPGRLEFMAGGGDQDMQPTMTNVTHVVRHLSFKDPEKQATWRTWSQLPREIIALDSPLDGRYFFTEAPHQTWEHHLRIVSAVTSAGVTYHFVHLGRLANVNESAVPQVRFHFDLEPFAIQVKPDSKQWYDFATSLLAALGGLFALMRLISRGLVAGGRVMQGKGRVQTVLLK